MSRIFLKPKKLNKLLPKHNYSTTTQELSYPDISNPRDGYILLNSRNKPLIPAIGIGTWGSEYYKPSTIANAVDYALKIGYRHINCAESFNNQNEIGEVLKDHFNNGLKREQLFISSKLYNDKHAPPDGGPRIGCEMTLKALNIDYLDSFLIQWPFRNCHDRPPTPFNPDPWNFTFKLMTELELQKLVKSVGVCNATIFKMKEMIRICNINRINIPSINEIEIHPYLQQNKIIEYCNRNNIIITAYMPLGNKKRPDRCKSENDPNMFNDNILKEISKEVGCSIAQVIIRWHLQRGIVCVPKGIEEWQIKENLDCLNIVLSEDQMNRISMIDKFYRFNKANWFRWEEDMRWEEMWDFEQS